MNVTAPASAIPMDIVIFVTIQTINVILSTVKSIITVNGSRGAAAWINAISYTFGAIVTKLLTQQSFEVIIIATMLTNLVGVYTAKWLMDKTKKPRLWTIMATVRGNDIKNVENELLRRSVQFVTTPGHNDRYLVNIFARTKGESAIAREILDEHDTKFSIVENRMGF